MVFFRALLLAEYEVVSGLWSRAFCCDRSRRDNLCMVVTTRTFSIA